MADYVLMRNTSTPVGYNLAGFTELTNEPAQAATISAIAVSAESSLVAFGLQSAADRLKVYIPDPSAAWTLVSGTPTMASGSWTVNNVAFSPNGGLLAVNDGGDVVTPLKVYETVGWTLVGSSANPPVDTSGDMSFSPNGAMFVAGQQDYSANGLFIFDTSTWTAVPGTPTRNRIFSTAWSPNGDYLAIYAGDDVVAKRGAFILSTSTWAEVPGFTTFSTAITAFQIAWHPDSTFVAFATDTGTSRILVYETATWSLVATLTDATHGLSFGTTIAFSTDGSLLIAPHASGTNTLHLFETTGWTAAGAFETVALNGPIAVTPLPLATIVDADMLSAALGASTMDGLFLILLLADMTDSATGASTMTGGAIFTSELLSSALGASTLTVGTIVPASMISSGAGSTTLDLQATLLALMYSYAAGNSVVPLEGDGQAAWAINAETGASTRYEQYPFNSFARINGKYYGAREDGIHLLEGDTDNGVPVQAMVDFGKQSFGTQAAKRMISAWFGASSSGRLFLRGVAEGEEYVYAARDSSEELQEQRVDIGRGLRANWFTFQLYSADGDDFELASVEFTALPLSRRT